MELKDDLSRKTFLLTALPDIPFDGWTEEVMARTAQRLKIPATRLKTLFPGGAADLIVCFSAWATEEALKKTATEDLAAMRMRDRIALGVRRRLEVLDPHKQAAAAALAFLTPPPRAFLIPKIVWKTADALWWWAGDTSTDYNHYTKRALLSGVLTSTALYWLNDTSRNHEKTWSFLDRRIDNVLTVGKKLSRLKKQTAH